MSDTARPWDELQTSGVLWLINKAVFHSRGFALALHRDQASNGSPITGWSLEGDGTEPWTFAPSIDEDALFAAAEAFLAEHRPQITQQDQSESQANDG